METVILLFGFHGNKLITSGNQNYVLKNTWRSRGYQVVYYKTVGRFQRRNSMHSMYDRWKRTTVTIGNNVNGVTWPEINQTAVVPQCLQCHSADRTPHRPHDSPTCRRCSAAICRWYQVTFGSVLLSSYVSRLSAGNCGKQAARCTQELSACVVRCGLP